MQLPKPEGRGPDSVLGGLEGEGGSGHSPDCDEVAAAHHAATGGDCECICEGGRLRGNDDVTVRTRPAVEFPTTAEEWITDETAAEARRLWDKNRMASQIECALIAATDAIRPLVAAVAERSEGSPSAPSFEGEREPYMHDQYGRPVFREGEPCENCSGTGGGPDAALTCVACGGSGWLSGEREGWGEPLSDEAVDAAMKMTKELAEREGATPDDELVNIAAAALAKWDYEHLTTRSNPGVNVGDREAAKAIIAAVAEAKPKARLKPAPRNTVELPDLDTLLGPEGGQPAVGNDDRRWAITVCSKHGLQGIGCVCMSGEDRNPGKVERVEVVPAEREAPFPVLYDELREAVVAQLEKLRPDRKLRKSGAYWDGYDDALDDAIDVAEGNPTVGQVVALSERERPCSPAPIPKEDD